MQAALARFLSSARHARELGAFYQRKRDRFLALLAATPLVSAVGRHYFQLATIRP